MIQPGMWYQGIIFILRFLEIDSRHVVAKITHHKEAEKFVKICKKKIKILHKSVSIVDYRWIRVERAIRPRSEKKC